MVSLLSFRTFSCNNIKSKHCKQLNSIDWAQYSRINSIFGSLLRYYRLVMLFCYLFMSHTQTEYNMRYHSYISDVALFFSNFVLLIERVYVCMFFFLRVGKYTVEKWARQIKKNQAQMEWKKLYHLMYLYHSPFHVGFEKKYYFRSDKCFIQIQ